MLPQSACRLPPGQQLAAPGKWPLVGERAPAEVMAPWMLSVTGLLARPLSLTLAELHGWPQAKLTCDIHCVTRWSKLDCRFRGIRLAELLAAAEPLATARYVCFVAHSERGHSTSLPLDDACRLGALVALEYEGEPLPIEHGGPIRVVVPGRYFYKSLKWLVHIELLADDVLGYWEAVAGYHNVADPWQEQRYIASSLSRQQVADVLARRDFRGLDLLGIDARGRDLAGLQAAGALLRNADFRGCNLDGADFSAANLSNVRFGGAQLVQASFAGADLEGADLAGADLRGADFRGASLLGATFVDEQSGQIARCNSSTLWDIERLTDLAPTQEAFVRSQLQ